VAGDYIECKQGLKVDHSAERERAAQSERDSGKIEMDAEEVEIKVSVHKYKRGHLLW
jgi:hypothetical protein